MNFNHKNGCQHCLLAGEYFLSMRRMSFFKIPVTNIEREQYARTDIQFRDRMHPEHHREYSILENLPIDMIKCFPSTDSLHLLHLGMMKR